MNYSLPLADKIRERLIEDTRNFAAAFEAENATLASMIAHYVNGTGIFSDHLVHRARLLIDERAHVEGVLAAHESVFDQFARVSPDMLRQFCPEQLDAYFEVGPGDWVTSIPVFGPSANTWNRPEFPQRLSLTIHRSDRPGFAIYRAAGLDVFVRPQGHQIYSKRHGFFWPSGSSRPFTRSIAQAPEQWIPGHIVAVQDRFAATNFAHFLFDYVTRIGHFVEAGLEEVQNCFFLLNGIPGRFQAILLNALSTTYGIPPDRFVFPQGDFNLRTHGQIYWFSDATEMYIHPAQMARPESIEIIRRIASRVDIAPAAGADSIYLSRRDADRRRLANEGDLWPLLEQRGFQFVTLSEHPVETQLAIIRRAKRIVAPHGMGMSYISLHLGSPEVLELFNPEAGGDAFAYMARAMGFRYDFLIGEPNGKGHDDFSVSPEDLCAYLDEARVPVLLEHDRRRNVISNSIAFAGRWSPGAQEELATPSDTVPQLFPGSIVLRHVRTDPARRPDSNSGCWWDMPVNAAEPFTASCFVWVPTEFLGNQVMITIGEWPGQSWAFADLSIRDEWQRISATATVPEGATSCSVVLRIEAGHEAVVFSTAWQLEAGAVPTPYQATP